MGVRTNRFAISNVLKQITETDEFTLQIQISVLMIKIYDICNYYLLFTWPYYVTTLVGVIATINLSLRLWFKDLFDLKTLIVL